MDEQDDMDCACFQQEQDERRRREDEALERHRVLLQEFRRETAEWLKEITIRRF